MSIKLDHEELHRLLAALADSDIQEFRLEGEDFRLEVRRNLPTSNGLTTVSTLQSVAESPSQQVQPVKVEPSQPSNPPPAVPATRADLVEVTAPMVGTFYTYSNASRFYREGSWIFLKLKLARNKELEIGKKELGIV